MPPSRTFEEARHEEEQNSLFAYLPYARPLLGAIVVPLRWSHVLELTLHRNAFFDHAAPLRGDFFEFLWRLNPYFRTGDGRFPNLPAAAARPSRFGVWLTRVSLWRFCRKLAVHKAEPIIRDWIAAAWQDAPTGGKGEHKSSVQERVSEFDSVSLFFVRQGLCRPSEILELPVAWTFQIMRAGVLSSGDDEARAAYIRPSAALLRFEDTQEEKEA